MEEVWKDVEGYFGYYQISDLGRLKTLPRSVVGKGGDDRNIRERILKGADRKGYIRYILRKDNHEKRIAAHRLVALHFLPIVKGKTIINHKNGIKIDNRVSNLEWCTPLENLHHAMETGLMEKPSPTNPSKVTQLDFDGKLVNVYLSAREAAKSTGIHRTSIINALHKRKLSAGGFQWCYQGEEESIGKIEEVYQKNAGIPVVQFSLGGEELNVFESSIDAEKYLQEEFQDNVKRASDIRKCCKGIRKTAYGYKWENKTLS